MKCGELQSDMHAAGAHDTNFHLVGNSISHWMTVDGRTRVQVTVVQNGCASQASAEHAGPFWAACAAVNKALDRFGIVPGSFKPAGYVISGLAADFEFSELVSDSVGVYVQCGTTMIMGHAAHADSIKAMATAYLQAVNTFMAMLAVLPPSTAPA